MSVSLNLGLLILRLIAGLTIGAHGAQKLFGWFEGPGMTKWTHVLRSQGFKPAIIWSSLTVLGELGGGLAVAFGFLTPLGAAGMFSVMFMAIVKSHWKNGFFNSKRGLEFPLSLLGAAVAIGLAGPGSYALDTLFGINFPTPLLFLILAVVGVLVDIFGLLLTRSASAPSDAPKSQTSS
ncbi:MAG TPA: DoxX family protein [Ktedonobacteraceae bacterium]|nr:DoxX family protein [Ktedonobacteraceae bacterium]